MDFAQSMDCPSQSSDRYFVQKSMDCTVASCANYTSLLAVVVYSKTVPVSFKVYKQLPSE